MSHRTNLHIPNHEINIQNISADACTGGLGTSGVWATPGDIQIGQTLPDGRLLGLNHADAHLAQWRGKPLLIKVWASRCSPCRAEMPSLNGLSRQAGARGLNIIGISTDDYPDRARRFLSQMRLSFPNFIDERLHWENLLGADRLPLRMVFKTRAARGAAFAG